MFARIRPYLPIAVLGFFVFYFGFQALTGDLGLLSWSKRTETLAAKRAEFVRVRTERLELEARAKLLRDGHLSRDLLEERARAILGLTDPRDYVIRVSLPRARPDHR